MKLSDYKIGTKVVGAFMFVALIGAGIGATGIVNMNKINDAAEVMYSKELLGISYIKEANINLLYIGRDIRNAILSPSEVGRQKARDSATKSVTLA